ncbi:MAG: Gfo/Idh/MocA family oxidoreductase [Verrucomicrobiae bacterium]|nr:Gfo/Idh/MocA family oxidoreductase [Verrucomicrobiae bacterium]MCX7722849.1 Gfo/Idh/MocA family oxidoreductase [Verrucomicrobiae bacterium]MDW7979505.1 Gfo/Idh/MocA family oxidoreductase [Verrucomicrobiales bacterium]
MAAPTILPARVLGVGDRPPPSERITVGIIGFGMQGRPNTEGFLRQPDCQVVAVCDVDTRHLEAGVKLVNEHYGNSDCKGYKDYRELCARADIDAVMVAVPDHWHALVAIEAARQRKDIYGEKPLARTVAEQQAIVRAVQRYGRIWQTGSWQRSVANFHKAAEIVRNGLIGKVTHVEVGLLAGHIDFAGTKDKTAVTAPPPELDYDFWTGPAQLLPYIEARVHRNWRWHYNTGGGQLLDWVGHHCDIAHWGLDFDSTGPIEVEGTGKFPPKDAVWNTCVAYRITLKYPGDITMVIAGGYPDIRLGTKWIGTDGWVWVNRGAFEASNQDWIEMQRLPEELRKIKLPISTDHIRNFLDSVKSRKPTITPVEVAHNSTIPGHLGLISMLVGRKIKWDHKNQRIVDDRAASELLGRTYRTPWRLT